MRVENFLYSTFVVSFLGAPNLGISMAPEIPCWEQPTEKALTPLQQLTAENAHLEERLRKSLEMQSTKQEELEELRRIEEKEATDNSETFLLNMRVGVDLRDAFFGLSTLYLIAREYFDCWGSKDLQEKRAKNNARAIELEELLTTSHEIELQPATRFICLTAESEKFLRKVYNLLKILLPASQNSLSLRMRFHYMRFMELCASLKSKIDMLLKTSIEQKRLLKNTSAELKRLESVANASAKTKKRMITFMGKFLFPNLTSSDIQHLISRFFGCISSEDEEWLWGLPNDSGMMQD